MLHACISAISNIVKTHFSIFKKKIYFTEKEVTKIELNRFHRKRQVNVLILLKETSTSHLLLFLTSRTYGQ